MIPRCLPCHTRRGFPGRCGGECRRPEFRPFEWSAPTNHLPLAFDRLGTVFNQLVETSEVNPLQLPAQPEAAPTLPDLPPLAILADQSVLQLEDGLAQRRLLAPLQLKSFTNTDILADSVVRVVVDAGGRPVIGDVALKQRFADGGPIRSGPGMGRTIRTREPESSRNRPQTDVAFELGQDDFPMAHRPDAARERPGGKPLTTQATLKIEHVHCRI